MHLEKKPFKPRYMTRVARKLRKNQTPHERKLWQALREREFFGHHLRRQAPFGRFVFDFYCAIKRIVIEVDGAVHYDQPEYDLEREDFVEACGVRVIRFTNYDVDNRIEYVLSEIKAVLNGKK